MKEDIIYLDYNSTSPLAKTVIDYLAKGDFPFANPSSLHQLGRDSKKVINSVKKFLQSTFLLKEHDIVFHSGATEWMNGFSELTVEDAFIYFSSDHPCVLEVAKKLKAKGVLVCELKINENAFFDTQAVIKEINKIQVSGKKWFNFTYVHNETGVVWPLDEAIKIKKETSCFVHVDAVQSVGKFEGWQKLRDEIDIYSFSSHKFGAFKTSGFSFFKKPLSMPILIVGGAQQRGLRAGTENPLACKAIELALLDAINIDVRKSLDFRLALEKRLKENSNIQIVAESAHRASNVVCFIHKELRADILQAKFDMAGLCVSTGSACSSGSLKPSETLVAIGYKDLASHLIRISFSPLLNFDKDKLIARILNVINE